MLQSIIEYQKIKGNLSNLLEASGYKNEYVAKKLGIKPTTFSVKKQRNAWTDSEVAKMMEVFTTANSEVEEFLSTQLIDVRSGGTYMTSEEFKSRLKWK